MINSRETLFDTIQKKGYNVYRQGSLTNEDKYDDTFFTYFKLDSFRDKFYDNSYKKIVDEYNLQLYTTKNIIEAEQLFKEVIDELEEKGFIFTNHIIDLPTDSNELNHIGLGTMMICMIDK